MGTTYRQAASGLIRQRWPQVAAALEPLSPTPAAQRCTDTPQQTLMVDGIHLSSGYDRASEAQQQAMLVPEAAAVAWVYGVGVGDLPRALLRRENLKTLHAVILNRELFLASLSHFQQTDWLADERVVLHLGAEMVDLQTPFCASPACLKLAEDAAASLRDCVVLELDTLYLNERFLANETARQQLEENASRVAGDADVSALFSPQRDGAALIAAAGPTLADHYDDIKQFQRQGGVVVALDAALRPLVLAGIRPDLVVTVDSLPEVYHLFEVDLSLFENTPLVYFPVVHQQVLAAWPGRRYVAYSDSPIYRDLSRRVSHSRLFSAGSVIHCAMDLVVKMGFGKVLLAGADFSYPEGMSHVENAVYAMPTARYKAKEWLINGMGEKNSTTKNLRGYLRDLERYLRGCDGVEVFNLSRRGAKIEGTRYLDETGGEDG